MEPDGEGCPADEAFRLLGNETRLAILHALWAATDERPSFSAIRETLGNPDSGRFNYHLGALRGHFLVDDGGGYRLTQAGREVVRAVLAGTVTVRPEREPAPMDAECSTCGGTLLARYDEYAVVECGECGETVMWNEFPPAGLDGRSPAEFVTAFDRWTRRRFQLATDGVCPSCAAPMTTEVADAGGDGIASMHRCRNCRYEARVPLVGHVVQHPATVAFFHEDGVDVTGLPYWELRALAAGFTEEVVSEEPWSAEITVESHGAALRLTVDDRFDVVDVERDDG